MYHYIVNPLSNRKVSIYSKKGIDIVNKYLLNAKINNQKGGYKTSVAKKLKDFNIVYINLDSRPERAESIEEQLKQNNLKATRISGINGKKLRDKNYRKKIANQLDVDDSNKLSPEFWMNRSNFKTMIKKEDPILGRVGCFLSHPVSFLLSVSSRVISKQIAGVTVHPIRPWA